MIVIAANVVNVVLEVLFVYGFGWGIEGSAWGTVIAQAGMGAAFIVVILRAAVGDARPVRELMRRLLVIGRHIFVRTAALLTAFTLAGAVIARFGDASLAAHQIAFQLWIFLALRPRRDRDRRPGDRRPRPRRRRHRARLRRERADDLALRLRRARVRAVMLALGDVLPVRLHERRERASSGRRRSGSCSRSMQPLNGAVFALDGILIGAGDGRYLMWSMVAAFAASAVGCLASLAFDWGIVGVWARSSS